MVVAWEVTMPIQLQIQPQNDYSQHQLPIKWPYYLNILMHHLYGTNPTTLTFVVTLAKVSNSMSGMWVPDDSIIGISVGASSPCADATVMVRRSNAPFKPPNSGGGSGIGVESAFVSIAASDEMSFVGTVVVVIVGVTIGAVATTGSVDDGVGIGVGAVTGGIAATRARLAGRRNGVGTGATLVAGTTGAAAATMGWTTAAAGTSADGGNETGIDTRGCAACSDDDDEPNRDDEEDVAANVGEPPNALNVEPLPIVPVPNVPILLPNNPPLDDVVVVDACVNDHAEGPVDDGALAKLNAGAVDADVNELNDVNTTDGGATDVVTGANVGVVANDPIDGVLVNAVTGGEDGIGVG
jgi:hypothetical protein